MKITKLLTYSGHKTTDASEGGAGEIIGLAGCDEIDIGDTLAADESAEALPFVEIDPPTIQMEIAVNDGPLAGRGRQESHFPSDSGKASARDEIQHFHQGP